jgi:hypothetical protein
VVDREARRPGLVVEREVGLERVPPLLDRRVAADRAQRRRIGRRERCQADALAGQLGQSAAPSS